VTVSEGSAAQVEFDPFDDVYFNDPYPTYAAMREQAPVYYSEKYDFYALSRFDDVAAALKDWETFSSSRGVDLYSIQNQPDYHAGIIQLDPPDHNRLRVLVSRAFTPRAIADMEPQVQELIDSYLNPLGSEFDLVQEFAAPFPIEMLSRLVGIPAEKRQHLRKLLDVVLTRSDGASEMSEEGMAAAIESGAYYYELSTIRREQPSDDMISTLISAEIEREDGSMTSLDDVEVASFLSLLGGAGAETVTKLVGSAAVLFAQHPDQWQMILDDPQLIPQAVEELLRFEPPSHYVGRYTTKPTTLHGVTIPAGKAVLLMIGAAVRDPGVFPESERFDITRTPRQNLSFGYGIHSCLGAALARMESRIALESMARKMPRYRVDESGLRRVMMSNVRGWSHVPVTVET
jgi:cytochrome P450